MESLRKLGVHCGSAVNAAAPLLVAMPPCVFGSEIPFFDDRGSKLLNKRQAGLTQPL
jgi:hypothetical protein